MQTITNIKHFMFKRCVTQHLGFITCLANFNALQYITLRLLFGQILFTNNVT